MVAGNLNVAIFKEGRTYIAFAPGLDLAAQGKTMEDVQKNFEEVLDIYLEEILDKGTLEKDLLRCGWHKHAGSMSPPVFARFASPAKIGKDIELTALAILPLSGKKILCLA